MFNVADKSANDDAVVIRQLLLQEKEISVPKDCLIGVGYTSCTDFSFRAVDLFKLLEPAIFELEKDEPIDPKSHLQITTLREFVETFLFHFMNGANAERVSQSKELFDSMIKQIETIDVKKSLGGHSSFWATRA